jgi:hypothetical protein
MKSMAAAIPPITEPTIVPVSGGGSISAPFSADTTNMVV